MSSSKPCSRPLERLAQRRSARLAAFGVAVYATLIVPIAGNLSASAAVAATTPQAKRPAANAMSIVPEPIAQDGSSKVTVRMSSDVESDTLHIYLNGTDVTAKFSASSCSNAQCVTAQLSPLDGLRAGKNVFQAEGTDVVGEPISARARFDGRAPDDVASETKLGAQSKNSSVRMQAVSVAEPGESWMESMLSRVDWLLREVEEHPELLDHALKRASLADHMLAAMTRFDSAPADVDSSTRTDRAGRRVAVRMAREFIHSRLSEPLRLSELCRHAKLKIRSLEYGFREVTGLTPIAYIRSVRLNSVRRALLQFSAKQRSISEIAMDAGFWHLSQFARDYRRFFGETPTQTRRRSMTAAPLAPIN